MGGPACESAASLPELLQGRNAAIQGLLREAAEAGRPVLVGTGSVQESVDIMQGVVQPFVE